MPTRRALLGEREKVADGVLQARALHERGLTAYFHRDFEEAAELFRLAEAARPDDKASMVLAIRSDELLRDPPPER